MDQPKIERMLRLMKLMSGNYNYTIDELAEKLDMSYRTIYRYIDTFKSAGFEVGKLYGNVYKLGKLPENAPDFDRLIYFSEEEAYIVNSLIDRLDPTNNLMVNLKQKLATIYDRTAIADFIDRKSDAGNVTLLAGAVRDKLGVTLKDYESGNSHTVRDRSVEPFAFTTNYIDVWAYDLEDGKNKKFKISRIGEVVVSEDSWTAEELHCRQGEDVFHMSGTDPVRVRLDLSLKAKNLLLEEYPLAERDLHPLKGRWMLDTQIYNYAGICRFYVGLAEEIAVVDSPEFEKYALDYINKNFRNGNQ